MEERRRCCRTTPTEEVEVTIGGHRAARVIDVSPGGARLELSTALNPRGECRLSLPTPNGTLRLDVRVVHCKLTGFAATDRRKQLVYRAGVEFIDLDPKLASSIARAYPPPESRPTARTAPIKVKIDVDAMRRLIDDRKGRAN